VSDGVNDVCEADEKSTDPPLVAPDMSEYTLVLFVIPEKLSVSFFRSAFRCRHFCTSRLHGLWRERNQLKVKISIRANTVDAACGVPINLDGLSRPKCAKDAELRVDAALKPAINKPTMSVG
jgi:hypothetical protein